MASILTPQSLLQTFESIDNRTLSDSILKSSLRRLANQNFHQQLLLARSLLYSDSGIVPSQEVKRFGFKARKGRLEWGAIENLDLDKIVREVCFFLLGSS